MKTTLQQIPILLSQKGKGGSHYQKAAFDIQ